jgi:hypothetical protein
VLTTLLHAREAAEVERGAPAVEVEPAEVSDTVGV